MSDSSRWTLTYFASQIELFPGKSDYSKLPSLLLYCLSFVPNLSWNLQYDYFLKQEILKTENTFIKKIRKPCIDHRREHAPTGDAIQSSYAPENFCMQSFFFLPTAGRDEETRCLKQDQFDFLSVISANTAQKYTKKKLWFKSKSIQIVSVSFATA